jgi:hypothetical protein
MVSGALGLGLGLTWHRPATAESATSVATAALVQIDVRLARARGAMQSMPLPFCCALGVTLCGRNWCEAD